MKTKIILASTSPRRRELLASAGYDFDLFNPQISELKMKGEKGSALVRRLAEEKALEASRSLSLEDPWVVVIASDTTVVNSKNQILEKPENINHAAKMLRSLSGVPHWVHTGVCLIEFKKSQQKIKTFVVSTQVRFRKLSQKEILLYLSRNESLDRAGAYSAQGHGMGLIESIRGSYTSVVGLPVSETVEVLKKWGVNPRGNHR